MARGDRRPVARQRIVYDNDATVITETPSVVADEPVKAKARSMNTRQVGMSLADAIDTFASYMPDRIKVTDKADGDGVCAVCGMTTPYALRKVCGGCMEKYRFALQERAHEAAELGTTAITLDVMD